MVWIGDKEYSPEEYEIYSRQRSRERMDAAWEKAQAREREREEAKRLIRKLGADYTEYTNFLEAHPHLRPQATGDPNSDQLFYQQLRQNLGHADDAPRCSHVKADGLRCGSPRLKTGRYCYAHQRMLASRSQKLPLLAMEDANAIQLSLMEVSRALLDGAISEKTAGLLFYALQTAAGNVGHTTFHQAPREMVVDEPVPPPPPEKRHETPDPDLSIYEQLDDDLRLRLQEISDEFDRRLIEKPRRPETPNSEAGDQGGEGTNAQDDKGDHAGADLQANPKLLTAADTAEHPALAAERFETAFTALGDAAESSG